MPYKQQSHYQRQRTDARRNKVSDPFYHSKLWRETRAAFLQQFPLCALCLAERRAVAANVVHHTTERQDLPQSEWCNAKHLQSLCASCHSGLSKGRYGAQSDSGQ